MSDTGNQVYSQQIIDFVAAANEFCVNLERVNTSSIGKFIDTTDKGLSRLYFFALHLPVLESKFEDLGNKYVDEQDYEFIRNKILKKLGQYDAFEEVFDENRVEYNDAVGASIAEHLADIYQDLKDFLLQYQLGSEEVMFESVYECQQSFINIWGQKLVNVLRPIHQLNFSTEELEENDNKPSENSNFNKVDTSNWNIRRRQEDRSDDE